MAKILLLDDEEQIRKVIALHLGKLGNVVITGKNGQEGLDLLARERFDLASAHEDPRQEAARRQRRRHGGERRVLPRVRGERLSQDNGGFRCVSA